MRILLATAVTATLGAGVFVVTQQQGPSAGDFCTQLEVVADVDETLATLDPIAVSGVSAQLRSLYDASPDGVRGNVGLLLAFADDVVEAVGEAPGEEEQAVQAVARRTDLDAVAAAGLAVERYARDECDIALASADDTTAPAPPPTAPTSTTRP